MNVVVRVVLALNAIACAAKVIVGLDPMDEAIEGLLWLYVWLLSERLWAYEREGR